MVKEFYNLIWNKDFDIVLKKSFSKEIDATFGVKDNKLVIVLDPSNDTIDWFINFDFFRIKVKPFYAKKESKVRVHRGYIKQWYRHRDEFFSIIKDNEKLSKAIKNGIYILGLSKGGAEAPIIALDLVKNFSTKLTNVFIGMICSPKVGNKSFANSVEKRVLKDNIHHIKYGADIVSKIPLGFKLPGNTIWLNKKKGLSFKDHEIGCFNREKVFSALENLE